LLKKFDDLGCALGEGTARVGLLVLIVEWALAAATAALAGLLQNVLQVKLGGVSEAGEFEEEVVDGVEDDALPLVEARARADLERARLAELPGAAACAGRIASLLEDAINERECRSTLELEGDGLLLSRPVALRSSAHMISMSAPVTSVTKRRAASREVSFRLMVTGRIMRISVSRWGLPVRRSVGWPWGDAAEAVAGAPGADAGAAAGWA